MPRTRNLLTALLVLTFALSFATPAHAFDGRSGDKVTIAAGEVVDDDLYVAATEFALDGTVNGDVIVAGKMITVNGKVDGNLIAAGQTIVVNGIVTGDVLGAGSVLYFGDSAQIGGDIVSAGYSLEIRQGTTVGRDAVMGGYQILDNGDVARNLTAGANGLEIGGTIGGNAHVGVSESTEAQNGPPPGLFLNETTVPVPSVRNGLAIDPAARIKGNLSYVQSTDLAIPAGVVAGTITRQAPAPRESQPAVEETTAQKVGKWGLNLVRTLVTLIIVGLLLAWLSPRFINGISAKLQDKPWPSLGLGIVAYAAFFFAILVILFVAILGAVAFGLVTLGGLGGAVLWIGILALLALIIGFVLAASFLSKIVFGAAVGRWILARARPAVAEHRYWPMLIGVTVIVLVVALLSFPLIPGALGWLLNLFVVLFGLGACWLWARDRLTLKPAAAG